jgi:hypothetical protein
VRRVAFVLFADYFRGNDLERRLDGIEPMAGG